MKKQTFKKIEDLNKLTPDQVNRILNYANKSVLNEGLRRQLHLADQQWHRLNRIMTTLGTYEIDLGDDNPIVARMTEKMNEIKEIKKQLPKVVRKPKEQSEEAQIAIGNETGVNEPKSTDEK